MGRAGGGGGSHGARMSGGGGHHSSSHSGGGHRASFSSGSSRAGSSRGSSFSGSPSRSHGSAFSGARNVTPPRNNAPNPAPPIINYYGGGFGSRRRAYGGGIGGFGNVGGVGCGGCSAAIVVVVIILAIFIILSAMMSSARYDNYSYTTTTSLPASSYNREKLSGTSWSNDCVVDEIGWISEDGSISGLERQLRKFYDKTGIQPYVYLVSYRPELTSDSAKAQFASEYYDEYIDNNYTFAFFYFEERNSDDVGYMHYEGGSSALGIMDAEAVAIFWAIADQEWYGNSTTEDCIANIFNRTAERIMTKTATKTDITKIVLIIVLVIVIAVVIIIIMNKRRKNEKERNEETRRILETPLE